MDSGYKYWAFISYSQRDDAFCQWLHKALETYRLPRHLVGQPGRDGPVPERLFPVFRDRDELPGAADLGEKLGLALRQSRCLVVICSPNSARSQWVNEEVRQFKAMGRADRVFPVIIGGEPYAGDERECFPPAVRLQVAADGSLSDLPAEPLAADARANKDGRQAALLKLIAGLLNVDYAQLVQRDQERRVQRLRWMVTAAAGLVVVFAGLAGFAYHQKNLAEQRESEARSRQLANQARLQQQAEPDLALLLALAGLDSAPTVDARGALLATLQTAANLEQVQQCAKDLVAVALSPDGRQLACGTKQGELYRLEPGRPAQLLKRLGNPVQHLAFSPDGRKLAVSVPVGCPDGKTCEWTDQVWVFDQAVASPATYVNALGGDVTDVLAFSPDGLWLFAGKRDGRLVAFSASGDLAGELSAGGDEIGYTALAVAPDGAILAGGKDGRLVHYVWGNSQLQRQETCALSKSAVSDVRWHAGSWWVRREDASLQQISGCAAQVVLKPRGGARATGIQARHRVAVGEHGVVYAAGNDQLVWCQGDCGSTAQSLAGHRRHVLGLWWVGKRLVSVDYGGKVMRWTPGSAQAANTAMVAASSDVRRLAFSVDGKLAAGALKNGRIAQWEPSTGKLLSESDDAHPPVNPAAPDFRASAVTFADRWLVSGGVGGDLMVWDPGTLAMHKQVAAHQCAEGKPCFVNALAWNAQHQWLASAGIDGQVIIWRLPGLTEVARLPHPKAVNGIAWSDDGSRLATAGADRLVRVWRWDGRQMQAQVYPDVHGRIADAALRSVRFVERDQRLISAGLDGTIVQWNTATAAKSDNAFDGAPGQLMLAASSPGAVWLATGHNGDAAVLWDYQQGRPMQTLLDARLRNSHHVEFSPDGQWLAVVGVSSGSEPAPPIFWQLDQRIWREMACNRANRNLTADEWRQIGSAPRMLCGR